MISERTRVLREALGLPAVSQSEEQAWLEALIEARRLRGLLARLVALIREPAVPRGPVD